MQTPDSIEAALSRLMPPALSPSGQRSIEAMLDELAATATVSPLPQSRRKFRYLIPSGIAAALILGTGAMLRTTPPSALPVAVSPAPAAVSLAVNDDEGIVLVRESSRLMELSDEGWLGTPDGDAVQAVRSRVIEASTFLDEETGEEVVVSEPREETVLMPVSVF